MYSLLNAARIQEIFKPRESNSNKGTHGHALLVAGSKGKMGAAVIASKAALRSGCGLLSTYVPVNERGTLQIAIPEAMLLFGKVSSQKLNDYSAVGIGPAIGTNAVAKEIFSFVIKNCNVPLVVDADGITLLSKNENLLKVLPTKTILTPHVKEFDRLYGTHDSIEQRMEKAIAISNQQDIIIVLKNAQTLITYKGQSYLNKTGNAGLAKGGSGDALTGMVLSFLAQGYDPFSAAQIAVYLHGIAAEKTVLTQSLESMLISDVIENIGMAFKDISE